MVTWDSQRPPCRARSLRAATSNSVLRTHDVIERILRHLALPFGATESGHLDAIAYDVTGEPMPGWVTDVDPEPPDAVERAPPSDWDCEDAAARDDGPDDDVGVMGEQRARDGGWRDVDVCAAIGGEEKTVGRPACWAQPRRRGGS
jgi:hypothetical protein